MYLETPYVLRGCGVRRSPEELGKLRDVADIVPAGCSTEFAYRHILEYAAAKFADGLLIAHR
jgi:hypothetical protein